MLGFANQTNEPHSLASPMISFAQVSSCGVALGSERSKRLCTPVGRRGKMARIVLKISMIGSFPS